MNRMKQLRMEKRISMTEAASRLKMPYTTYVNYEKGLREPSSETLIALADFFNVSVDYLIGREEPSEAAPSFPSNLAPLPPMKKIPLLGQIACGEPITAEENIEDYIDLPAHIKADFALACKGDSMTGAGIKDGDIVYIKQRPTVENGQIAAVVIDGEATLKRFYRVGNTVTLNAENPAFAPLVYVGDDINKLRIAGLAVAFTHVIEQ